MAVRPRRHGCINNVVFGRKNTTGMLLPYSVIPGGRAAQFSTIRRHLLSRLFSLLYFQQKDWCTHVLRKKITWTFQLLGCKWNTRSIFWPMPLSALGFSEWCTSRGLRIASPVVLTVGIQHALWCLVSLSLLFFYWNKCLAQQFFQ